MNTKKRMSKNRINFIIILVSITLLSRPYGELFPDIIQWGTLPRIFSMFLILITSFIVIKKNKIYLPNEVVWLILYFIYVFIISISFNTLTFITFASYIFPFLMSLIILNLSNYLKNNFKIPIWFYIIGTLFLVIVSILTPYTHNEGRITVAAHYSPIYIAYFSATGIAAILSIYKKEKKGRKNILIIIGLILGVGILLSQTMTVIGSLILSFFIYNLLNYKKYIYEFINLKLNLKKIFIIMMIFIFLLISFYVLITNRMIFKKLVTSQFAKLYDLFANEWGNFNRMTSGRYNIWKNTINIIKKDSIINLFFGRGRNSYKNFHENNYLIKSSPHNSYIYILFETGIIGLILFLLFIISLYRSIKKGNNKLLLIIYLYMLIVPIGNDVFLYHHYWLCWLFIKLNNY